MAPVRVIPTLAVFTLLGTTDLSGQIAARATFMGEYSFELPAPTSDGPIDPRGVAVAPDGFLHIVDREGKIVVLHPSGDLVRTYGVGSLVRPQAVAFDDDGRAYVLDGDLKDVHVFDGAGTEQYVIGGAPGSVARIEEGVDLAVGPGGFVYILDKGGRAVRIFGRDGAFVRNLGLGGAISDPTGIAVDGDGRILISDKNTSSMIFEFPAFYELAWTGAAPPTAVDLGSAAEPMAVTVDGSGVTVVMDGKEQQIWDGDRVAPAARPQTRALYGGSGSGRGAFREAVDITFAPGKHLVILDRGGRKIERLRLAATTGRSLLQWEYPLRVSQLPPDPSGAVMDLGGSNPATPQFASVQRDGEGTWTVSVGTGTSTTFNDFYGDRFETFALPTPDTDGYFRAQYEREPGAIAVNDTLLVVVEPSENLFAVWDVRDGSSLGTFGNNYEDDRRLRRPTGVALFSDASIVIADRGNGRIAGFSTDLASLLASFPFPEVAGVAISPAGELVAWNGDGRELSRIPLDGAPPEPLPGDVVPGPVQDVTFDADGNLFILEIETSRVTVVDPAMERILVRVGGRDPDFKATYISVDGSGNIYIANPERANTLVYRWDRADGGQESPDAH